MKTKLIITLCITTLILLGCKNTNEKPNTYVGYELSTINYDGHDYILCSGSNGGGSSVTIIHSASCKYCNNKK